MVAPQDPFCGFKPEPPAGHIRLCLSTATQLGWTLAGAASRRLLLAVETLLVPAAVTYGVRLIEFAWHSTLQVTVLGEHLLVHGGLLMMLADMVTRIDGCRGGRDRAGWNRLPARDVGDGHEPRGMPVLCMLR